jgi:Uma2 family endonuclease
MVATRLYTVEDLEALPDDGQVYELIDGKLVRREPVGAEHGDLGAGMLARLWVFLRGNPLGRAYNAETIFRLQVDPEIGVKPDVSFVRKERLPPRSDYARPLELAPDLVVEVVSPNDRAGAIEEKIELYQRFGVPLIWLLWPRRHTISVLELGRAARELREGDVLDGGDVLPGFRVPVADLFDLGL